MLDGVEPLEERRLVIALEHGDALLGDDRPAVECRVHEVDGDAGDGDAGAQRVAHGVEPRKGRQQRGVDIEDPAAEPSQDFGADEPQVAGEHDRVQVEGGERVREGRVITARHEHGLDPLLRRPVQGRAWPVGEHQRDVPAQRAPGRDRRQRTQVRPAARHADRDPRRARLAHVASA